MFSCLLWFQLSLSPVKPDKINKLTNNVLFFHVHQKATNYIKRQMSTALMVKMLQTHSSCHQRLTERSKILQWRWSTRSCTVSLVPSQMRLMKEAGAICASSLFLISATQGTSTQFSIFSQSSPNLALLHLQHAQQLTSQLLHLLCKSVCVLPTYGLCALLLNLC